MDADPHTAATPLDHATIRSIVIGIMLASYASSDHLSKTAPQLAAVRAMLDRLAEPREGSPVL